MIVVDGVEMMDVREAARIADRSAETIRRWVWTGRLPARRDGNRLLLERSAVLALVNGASRAGPEAQLSGLAAWAKRAHALQRPVPGSSAADLVLEDRRNRTVSSAEAHAGR